jgi:hypothetical protein
MSDHDLKLVIISLYEQQVALLSKNIAILKGNGIAEVPTVLYIPSVGSKAVKKTKIKKDPSAPKKPISAYALFFVENQKIVKAANPVMTQLDVMTSLGNRWTKMSTDDRKKYLDELNIQQERYKVEMADYTASRSSSSSSSSTAVNVLKKVETSVLLPVTATSVSQIVVPSVAQTEIEIERKRKEKKRKRKEDFEKSLSIPSH